MEMQNAHAITMRYLTVTNYRPARYVVIWEDVNGEKHRRTLQRNHESNNERPQLIQQAVEIYLQWLADNMNAISSTRGKLQFTPDQVMVAEYQGRDTVILLTKKYHRVSD